MIWPTLSFLWFFQLEVFKFCYVKDTRQTLQMAWNGGRWGQVVFLVSAKKKIWKLKYYRLLWSFLLCFNLRWCINNFTPYFLRGSNTRSSSLEYKIARTQFQFIGIKFCDKSFFKIQFSLLLLLSSIFAQIYLGGEPLYEKSWTVLFYLVYLQKWK